MKKRIQPTCRYGSGGHHTMAFLAAWTVILGASLGWNLYRVKQDFQQRALIKT